VTSGKHSEHDSEPASFVHYLNHQDITSCTVLHGVSKNSAHTQSACGFNCGYSGEDFRSMTSPDRWSVWLGCPPLGHIGTAQCSVGPVALSSCTVQIQ